LSTSSHKQEGLKTCLLFPPQWTPFNPHFALYTLAGHLRSRGIPVDTYDINLTFFNYLFSASYIEKFKQDYLACLSDLQAKQRSLNSSQQRQLLMMKQFIEEERESFDHLQENVQSALQTFKDPELFYQPDRLALAANLLEYFFKIFSLPHYPASIFLSFYHDHRFKLDLQSLIDIIGSENSFFEEYLAVFLAEEIYPKHYDVVAISINTDSQVLAGLTLAHKLKKKLHDKVHITIGGNYFTRLTSVLESKPQFFKLFADSLVWGEGEVPLEKLIKAVEAGKGFQDVPNLLYWDKHKGSIQKTEEQPWIKNLDELGMMDLAGIPLKDYLCPEISLPIQYSRGCYWGKCTFCDHFYGPKMGKKTMERLLAEIKHAQHHGINKFVFVDEMLSPLFVKAFSERLIEEGITIHWFTNCRTESGFTDEVMKLAYQAGLRMVMWGVESGNKRIMTMINKGVDLEKRFEPLGSADMAGIWNFAFIFFGFPTETIEEAFETIKCVSAPEFHIDSYGKSVFTPGKQSAIVKDPVKYGISEIYKDGLEFATWYNYTSTSGMTKKKTINKITRLCSTLFLMINKNQPPVWFKFINRDVLFLYLCQYGKKKIKSWRFRNLLALRTINKLPQLIIKHEADSKQ
jgi:radical SAM superfamily enzyme YgiQ (UPF0313 family)